MMTTVLGLLCFILGCFIIFVPLQRVEGWDFIILFFITSLTLLLIGLGMMGGQIIVA